MLALRHCRRSQEEIKCSWSIVSPREMTGQHCGTSSEGGAFRAEHQDGKAAMLDARGLFPLCSIA
jgi:hypothetical protein